MRFLASILLAAMATTASAHAVLTGTSLEGKTVRAGAETTVTLRFNSAIEAGLSQVKLVDAERHERALPLQPETTAGHVVVKVPPLEPGAYGLHYKIFAVDGHVTENVLRFTAALAE
ncbi:MAG TPA: copper resistance CopC family protein [Candidatus Binatia bacterium]|jgi:methionine-rich copper-binding protein CopC|nr:copper resistance CopC family protein [Candidatus Binatia bacterium]